MASSFGNIWAQAMWDVSVISSGFTFETWVVFSKPRNIHAYSSLSSFSVLRDSHNHGAFGGGEPPWLASGTAGIGWYQTAGGVGHPQAGISPRINVSNATEVMFETNGSFLGDGMGGITANHIINYFPDED